MTNTKTCYKCDHYHCTMSDSDSFYHFHDFCDFWKRPIPSRADSPPIGFDDVEQELAYCWGYDEKRIRENEK